MKKVDEKFTQLKNIISEMKSVVVAYSGGVDSTLLLKIAHDTLKNHAIAVTANSPLYPNSELIEAKEITKSFGIKHIIITSDELKIPNFAKNPKNRCYLCKKALFSELKNIAKKYGIKYILDGSNATDTLDFRPGIDAAKEFGVRSPLKEVGLTKDEIRRLSKDLGLPTYNKPAKACLASRFPYGDKITYQALKMVEKAEEFLQSLGIHQVRVRHHQNICRIEVPKEEMHICFSNKDKIIKNLKILGYTYITLDLEGYRTGSMNEV
jgi:uncharacterized protein